MLIDKHALLSQIRSQLESELVALTQAAKAAHEAATHEESKAEDSHDTRGLESSYLAGAQAQRASEIQQTLNFYKQVEFRQFSAEEPIAALAVVELEANRKKTLYLIAPQGGGMRISIEGKSILTITPHSPVGEELVGRRVGDTIEVEAQGVMREFLITAVQ
jgi:transcription elongation GreA/GreB family factor